MQGQAGAQPADGATAASTAACTAADAGDCLEGAELEGLGLAAAHDLFAELLLAFLEVWRVRRPPSGGLGVMGFPPLFKAFQREQERRLLPHALKR